MRVIREQMRKSRAAADAAAYAAAAADAAAAAAAAADAAAWRKKHRPLATRLLKEYVRVLIHACAVESPAPQEPTP
jgi:hypothetical protein